MKSIRLLPVVIFAAVALLLFKGVALVTTGGYVLGPVAVVAAEEGGESAVPSEPTAMDTSPVMGDVAPTMAARVEAPPSSSSAAGEHGAPAPSSAAMSSSEGVPSPSSQAAVAEDVCPEAPKPASAAHGEPGLNDRIGNALASGCPPPPNPVNEHGDALPMTKDGNGKIVPLEVVTGDNSEPAILQRLAERRTELDKREGDIAIREATVAAAEARLEERTKALQDLQAEVNALVDQKQAAEDEGFKSVVSMYETMKPKDAAKIFDTLDPNVLIKVARAINPRKMAPILAAMSAGQAQILTTALADTNPVNTVADAGTNPAALPQIVGH
ncbi:MAG: MotE family protein [Devosia sp.]